MAQGSTDSGAFGGGHDTVGEPGVRLRKEMLRAQEVVETWFDRRCRHRCQHGSA